jgi:GGDEF domain-containing protein
MTAQELMIWSMALGAIATVGVARLADLLARPSFSQLRGVGYHAAWFVLVFLLCGLGRTMAGIEPGLLHVLQVLAGPVCVGLANFWIRGWLGAHQRDRLMSIGLRGSALLLPLAGLAALALPRHLQLPAAAAASLLGATLTLWLVVRGWLMGDRMAPMMALGCLLALAGIAGLYAVAANVELGAAGQGVAALAAAFCNGFTGFELWRRNRREWKTSLLDSSVLPYDPVTKLHSSVEMVRRLFRAQKRRRRTRRDGAVLAIVLFDVERLASQVGTAGVNEMFIAVGSRIQRQVGVVNPVGRYWDRCFVALVETIHSPRGLRTLGLRVATSLRQPMEVAGLDGRRAQVRLDVGVGVVHLPPGQVEVEEILHDAERMAEAARQMRSRAAMLDPATGEVVPVEEADLGPRRQRHAGAVPRAGTPRARPR